MSFETKIIRQEIQLENYPDYSEVSICDNPNCSFYGSLGLGLIEILLRSHSCPQLSCNLFNVIQENISKLDEIILNKGLDKERKIFCQLVDLMNYKEYTRNQLAQWLHCYMSENRDSAVTSMITMVQLIIYNLCESESFSEEILNLSSQLSQPTFENIIRIICENFPVHMKIIAKDIKIYSRLGTNTFPVINLYKSDNSSYLLLYNKHVSSFDKGTDKLVNIFVEPFVETHTGIKLLDKPKPNMNSESCGFKLENIKEGQIVITDDNLSDSISILPPGPNTYNSEAMKVAENIENEEFKGGNNEKNWDNKPIGSEDGCKNDARFRPSSNLEVKQNTKNQGQNEFMSNFFKAKEKETAESEGKTGSDPQGQIGISVAPRKFYQDTGKIPIVSNPPLPIPVPPPNYYIHPDTPKGVNQVPQIPINYPGTKATKENLNQNIPKPEIQPLKNTNPNDIIKPPPIKENSSPNSSAFIPPSNPSYIPPISIFIPGVKSSENIPSNTNFPPQNFMTAKNDFNPNTSNQNILNNKNNEISAKIQVGDPSEPRKFFKVPDINFQVPHQIKPPGQLPYPNIPGQINLNANLGKDDKNQIPQPADLLKSVPKIPTPVAAPTVPKIPTPPVTVPTVPKILTPVIASNVPIVTHCPLPGQQGKSIENPFPPPLQKIQPNKNLNPPEAKIPSNSDPQIQQDPYHNIGTKPNNYIPMPPTPPQTDSNLPKHGISQEYVSFGLGSSPSQQHPFANIPLKPETQIQNPPDNLTSQYSGTFNIPNPNIIFPSPSYIKHDKDTPSFSANDPNQIILPPVINTETNKNKNYIPPGSYNIPMPSSIENQFGKPPFIDYANRPRFDRKLLDVVGIMSEIITSEKNDYRNMLEKISRIMDGDSELSNIESLMSLENYRKAKINMMGTGKIRCGVCKFDKERDEFSIICCKEDNCKCCSKCRTLDISNGCPCCSRIYSDYEIDLLNVAKVSLQ